MNRQYGSPITNQMPSWCCALDSPEDDGEIGVTRKNILLKSANKNKTQKTSLKKRSGTCEFDKVQIVSCEQRQTKMQEQIIPWNISENKKPGQHFYQQPIPQSQIIPHSPYPMSCTPQKSSRTNKINFTYNVKDPQVNTVREGYVQPRQLFECEKTDLKQMMNTGIYSISKGDMAKSTQHSNIPTQKIRASQEIPIFGPPPEPKLQKLRALANSNRNQTNSRAQDSQPLISLSSRKQTVLSINGDSESERSIAIMDLEMPPLTKHISIGTSRHINQRQKWSNGGKSLS